MTGFHWLMNTIIVREVLAIANVYSWLYSPDTSPWMRTLFSNIFDHLLCITKPLSLLGACTTKPCIELMEFRSLFGLPVDCIMAKLIFLTISSSSWDTASSCKHIIGRGQHNFHTCQTKDRLCGILEAIGIDQSTNMTRFTSCARQAELNIYGSPFWYRIVTKL
jgi:hypothetical protein